jgi:hypothetical protein
MLVGVSKYFEKKLIKIFKKIVSQVKITNCIESKSAQLQIYTDF